jgi:hypothetical protein
MGSLHLTCLHGYHDVFIKVKPICDFVVPKKITSFVVQFHHTGFQLGEIKRGSHLGGRARLPDTILEEDHPMTIPSKFGSN